LDDCRNFYSVHQNNKSKESFSKGKKGLHIKIIFEDDIIEETKSKMTNILMSSLNNEPQGEDTPNLAIFKPKTVRVHNLTNPSEKQSESAQSELSKNYNEIVDNLQFDAKYTNQLIKSAI
jgi:hypothetical protein